MSDDVVEFLATRSGGDARAALNALELALHTTARTGEPVTLADAEDAMQRKALRYDKAGDQHYDLISAWIKSTRGSDRRRSCPSVVLHAFRSLGRSWSGKTFPRCRLGRAFPTPRRRFELSRAP